MRRPRGASLTTATERWSRRIVESRARWRAQQLALAASGVSNPWRFVAGELRGGTRGHRTRGGRPFLVRHGMRDVDLVAEVFGQETYRMPVEVRRRLGPGLRVLDAGGNTGLFGVYAIEHWDVSRLCSFEPDPANAALLERVIAANPFAGEWRAVRAAVAPDTRPMRFLAEGSSLSRRADAEEPGILVECVDLFEALGRSDVLKLDIEGGEWALLADPRWPTIDARAIVMEWHWRGAPAIGGREAARTALAHAGFRVIEPETGERRADVGLIWGLR